MAAAPDLSEYYAEQLRSVEQSLKKAIERRQWLDARMAELNTRRAAVQAKRLHQNTLIQQLRDRRAAVRTELHDALET